MGFGLSSWMLVLFIEIVNKFEEEVYFGLRYIEVFVFGIFE